MSLRILAGRANTGKSSFIYNEIKSRSEDKKDNLILIVPELMTYQAESSIIERFGLPGIMNIEILSFKRLERKVLEEVGGLKVQDISVFGKIMLLKQIFEGNKDKLKIFGNSCKQSGFLKEFEKLTAEFKQNLVDSQSLKNAALQVTDEILMRKLSDIELIYSEFIKRSQGKYFDEEDKTNLCISLIKDSAYIRKSKIWIDGFESFNYQRLHLIKALCENSRSVTASLNIDSSYFIEPDEKDDYEAFKIIYDTYINLKKLDIEIEIISVKDNMYSSPEIKAVEKNMFSLNIEEYENQSVKITVYSSLNPYRETQKTAAEIISLVRDKGYRWRDIKLALGSMDTYETNVKRIFAQYKIPYFLDVKRDILNNPLSKYILSIFDMFIWKFKHDNVFEYLKTGFSPLSIKQVHLLENYALEYGIEGEKWFREFKTSGKDEDNQKPPKQNEMEEYRKLFAGDFETERKEIQNLKRADEITKLIFKYLKKHKVKEKMEKAVKGFNAMHKFEEASEYSQCWNYVMEVFEQLMLVGKDTEISVREYRKMLEAGLGEVEVSIIPPAIDKVEVGEINRIAVTKPKALFIIGANDSNLDAKNTEKGLLLNEERELLLENHVKLTKGADYDTFKEKHMHYKLFSSPSQSLYISYPMGLETGESLQPSLYIDILKKIFVNMKAGSDLSIGDELESVSNYGGTYDYFVENMRSYIDGYEVDKLWRDVYAWYEKEDKDNFYIINKALKYKNSMDTLEPETVKSIYENNMTMTVSKFETYAQCQFKYFMENVLKPRERVVQKIEFYDLGDIYHSVVEEFINKIKEECKDLSLLDMDRAEEEAVRITNEVLKNQEDKLTAIEANYRNKYMKEKIKRVMKRTCRTLAGQLNSSMFRPAYTELKIDERNEKAETVVPPIEISVDTEKIKEVLKLRGKIDRVDVFENKDKLYVSIIDYKSSPNEVDLEDAKEGIQVQLIMYLKALIDKGEELFGRKTHVGGVFYYFINDPMLTDDNKLKDPEEEIFKKLKLKGYVLKDKEVVKLMDKNIDSTSKVIQAALKKDGNIREDWTKALTEEEFKNVMDIVYEKCADMTRSILEGNINIDPYRKPDGKTPCTYCDYISICQFDSSLGNNYRPIGTKYPASKEKQEILTAAEAEGGYNELD
ncbi:MAG TPA: PD-(D/E)XK nuclease family protein [Sedimentibacter sp.]|nr:PD-(D/E)XK nuclease family protein [Sedimentibacter sp.]